MYSKHPVSVQPLPLSVCESQHVEVYYTNTSAFYVRTFGSHIRVLNYSFIVSIKDSPPCLVTTAHQLVLTGVAHLNRFCDHAQSPFS